MSLSLLLLSLPLLFHRLSLLEDSFLFLGSHLVELLSLSLCCGLSFSSRLLASCVELTPSLLCLCLYLLQALLLFLPPLCSFFSKSGISRGLLFIKLSLTSLLFFEDLSFTLCIFGLLICFPSLLFFLKLCETLFLLSLKLRHMSLDLSLAVLLELSEAILLLFVEFGLPLPFFLC